MGEERKQQTEDDAELAFISGQNNRGESTEMEIHGACLSSLFNVLREAVDRGLRHTAIRTDSSILVKFGFR